MAAAPHFAIVAARASERPVHLRLPFRFGAATVTQARQAFVQVRIRLADGREASGAGAELMIPKWFDKSPGKSNDRNVDDLRASVLAACAAYASTSAAATAFGHAARHHAELMQAGARWGCPPLAASFGGALVDRAVLDALCVATGTSFAAALNANLPGIDASLAPDLAGFAFDAYLRYLQMPESIAARHTVGLLDPLTAAEVPLAPSDTLPHTLAEVVARYGHRHFKLKLAGHPDADIARLTAIARVLDPLPELFVTLDGNEQFAGASAVVEFIAKLRGTPALRRLAAATLYLEQPLPRDAALAGPAPGAETMPLLIDETDGTFDAWPAARACGYTGVSSKSCKGLYKSLINAMRCAQWNAAEAKSRYFMSAEDLTTQAGLALQQDLALAGILGMRHVERNGHHYVDGFAGQGAPAAEQAAFAAAHPDLYDVCGDNVRVAIRDGRLSLRSLGATGFATAARPDFAGLAPIVAAASSPHLLADGRAA
jgi:hypothetical protein